MPKKVELPLKEDKRCSIADFASMLEVDIAWVASTLNSLGVTLHADNTFSTRDFRDVLKTMRKNKNDLSLVLSPADTNEWICDLFRAKGITALSNPSVKASSTWILYMPDRKIASVEIYHIQEINPKTNLITVSIEIPTPPCRWALFALIPWNRYELRNVEDLQKSRRTARKKQLRTTVHFVPGNSRWLFADRIREFIQDPLAWA